VIIQDLGLSQIFLGKKRLEEFMTIRNCRKLSNKDANIEPAEHGGAEGIMSRHC
jgi:hypothetical protein